ncbi:multiubiquitin domain-containing protein [Novosphingobium terrae]|uniref:multiubiquitin domain-containing protein n=1 Tax=Novosphingobium terrae TaxID=2726189 RepID=UPI00197F2953|nr:multiubiquitin domain-containing protein [Novosphingobium terrae]
MNDEEEIQRVVVDGRALQLPAEGLTGRVVLAAVDANPEDRDVLIRVDGGWARMIAPDAQVVGAEGEARFRLHRKGVLRYLRVDDRLWEWGSAAIYEHDIREIGGIGDDLTLHLVGGDRLRPGALVDLSVNWVPGVVTRSDRGGTVPVVINGRQQNLPATDIDFEDLVRLAYPDLTPDTGRMFTVSYRHGPMDRPVGLLAPRQRMRLTNGATYNVTRTDKG